MRVGFEYQAHVPEYTVGGKRRRDYEFNYLFRLFLQEMRLRTQDRCFYGNPLPRSQKVKVSGSIILIKEHLTEIDLFF